MKKLVNFIVLYFSIFIVEIISCFILSYFFSISIFQTSDLMGSLNVALLWNVWRLIFFGLPLAFIYLIFFDIIESLKISKSLLLSIINVSTYVALSVLSRLIWGKNIPLPPEGIMFWISIITIFISPFVLQQISYFKNLINKTLNSL